MADAVSSLRTINPFSLKPAGEYPCWDFSTLERGIGRAQTAYRHWRKVPVAQRVLLLRDALSYFERESAAVAKDITSQMGKPLKQAEGEVRGLLERADYLLSIAESALAPEALPDKAGFLRRIEHVPLGVVLVIAPWNYPLLTAINGVLTALLAGNAVLLKHSGLTPAVGEHFERAFGTVGPVSALLQSFQSPHAIIEKALGESAIDHLVFTGSVEGGRRVQQAAASRFIDCNLELGGKDAAYVAPDADVSKAAADLVDGAMYNAGQSCCGIERVYVHAAIWDKFIEAALPLVNAYVLGDPMSAGTTLGPLASAQAAEFMRAQVEAAVAGGAMVLAGGKPKKIGAATFFEPTLLTVSDAQADILKEENFGPILPLFRVGSEEEAVARVNDSRYGLSACIYTADPARADRFAAEAEVGTVFMNRCDYLDPALPWTGVKDSGRGSTLSRYGFYSLSRRKAIHFRLP